MAGKSGRQDPVIDALHDEPFRYDFYQAVRMLELAREIGTETDEGSAVPVGETSDPAREAVRFSADPSLGFPPSPVVDIDEPTDDGKPVQMLVSFLGLAGAQGPLPRPFTERILKRLQTRDRGMAAFLDIFNHRLVSMMVRLRKRHRVALEPKPPEKTHFAHYLKSIIGIGTLGLAERTAFPDRSALRYAGLFAHRHRTVAGFENLLSDFLGLPVQVRQFIGRWWDLDREQLTILGGPNGQNDRLGQGATLGTRVWLQQSDYEIVIGPVTVSQMRDLLPGQPGFDTLGAIAPLYATPENGAKIRFVCEKASIPEMRLGRELRLGWTTWLGTDPDTDDGKDDQVVVPLRRYAPPAYG